jgi:hypothetical protein
MRKLSANDNISAIITWLKEYLNDEKSTLKSDLSDKKSIKDLFKINQKGIYFWFMRHDAYESFHKLKLSKIELLFEKEINGTIYHLVYLGTAGVRKNKNEKNNSFLLDRFNWHLFNAQSDKSVLSGHMSTLRRTLGSLISDDLILNKTQEELSKLIEDNFFIYFLEYGNSSEGDDFSKLQKTVSNDETCLIKNLKPIFNIAQNPNAQKNKAIDTEHLTKNISDRRKKVENDTKNRIKGESAYTPNVNATRKNSKGENKKETSNNNDQLNESKKGHYKVHTSFTVKVDENIHEVIRERKDLPEGKFRFKIVDSINEIIWIYKNLQSGGYRTTKNLKKYFNSDDTEIKKNRWEIIKQEMVKSKITEVKIIIEVS